MRRNLNIAVLLMLAGVSSCGLFDTRDVQTPSQPRSTFQQPTSPDIVLSNLNFAIAEKNVDNYMRCFVDTAFSSRRFRFIPDAVSSSSYPVFIGWDLSDERIYYNNLVSLTGESSSSNLFLSNLTLTSGIDSAVIDSDYILVFDHNRQNLAKVSNGKLRFIMSPDSRSLWSIHSWQDFLVASGDTTWSYIKANFIN
ncbi:MAG: hypothetical protein K1X85_02685 [Ignavibacteria bacterium]|nr:hypothetical protein [Ignavibacteria bacterium]